MTSIHNYDDIINLRHPEPRRHTRMSVQARAAQFMPFAALIGYSSVIEEVSRTTDSKLQLDEGEINRINKKLRYLKNQKRTDKIVKIHFFRKDDKKDGGSYISVTGQVKKIDEYARVLTMSDGTMIAFDDIFSISIDDPQK